MSNASDFVIENGVLIKYVGPGGNVVIPNGVISIGCAAFAGCGSLTSVLIPDSVTSIEDLVFYGCENLASAVIPNSIKSIGDSAFSICKNLISVTIPDSVTSIGYEVFSYCSSLTSVTIPDSVTSIGKSAFSYCKNLTSVTIPDSVTSIGDSAFFYCRGLTSITIPDSVTSIGNSAFMACDNLKRVTLPASVGPLFAGRFYYSKYTKDPCIDILDISALPAKFRIYAALCFAKDGGDATDPRYENHIKYLKTNAGKIIDDAVQNLPLLTLLCRENCIKAKDIEAYTDAVQRTGDAEKITLILDYQNNKLTLKEKEQAAKKKGKQENVIFERTVARMNQEGIGGLNFVVSGALITFANRNAIKAYIESQGGKLQSSVSADTDYLITNGFGNTEKIKQAESMGIEIISELEFNDKTQRAFAIEDGKLIEYRGTGGDVTVPNGVTAIGKKAFYYYHGLRSVTIPDSVTSIGYKAFSEYASLTIHAPADSYAETYARKNNIPFVAE